VITTIQPGYFTTVQDEGRWGYQAYGMPIAGAMDRYACRVANLLVGNSPNAAVLEMTAVGAAFKFDEEQQVAVCGAEMQGKVNGLPVSNWSSFVVQKGGELRFEAVTKGYRTYLAVRGGFAVPLVLGSRSTCTRAKVGGFEGRTLRQGDVLYVGQDSRFPVKEHKLEAVYIPNYTGSINLRVMLGPQDNMFSHDAVEKFFKSVYAVTNQIDRIGYWLKGPKVMHSDKADIVSDAMWPGAIQIPSNGMPFIMTADHQTTGGFAKIGSVIRSDLTLLAQASPGDTIHFCCVAEDAAIQALREEERCYDAIMRAVVQQQ